jgi:hypothetical protein
MDGTTTTTSGGAGEDQRAADAPTPEQPQLLATAVGDQCAGCGAQLAGDQRYCVECGERRGKPRYALAGSGMSSGRTSSGPGGRRRPRMSASSTLIAGVGTLLLAMGVGVLIGRTSAGSTPRNSPVQVVTLAAAGGTATGGTASTASTPPKSAKASSSTATAQAKAKSAAAKLSAKLPPAAKKIPKKLQSSVAKVGSKCAGGGTFTGTFFGSGASRTGCTK